jgi:hypothetical protein
VAVAAVTADRPDALPLLDIDGDHELQRALAEPVPVPPPEPPADPGERAMVAVTMPTLTREATVMDELDAAAVGAVRVLRHAMIHGESTPVRVTAARAILGAAMTGWGRKLGADPLGDLLRKVTAFRDDDGQG